MIDFEVNVFDKVYRKVSPLCAKGKFVSVYNPTPTAYPSGSLVELINRTDRKRQSSTPIENFAIVAYQLDVYALSKKEAKEVYAVADDAMIALGFTRTSGTFLDNADNVNVFRYVASYEAEIDRDGNIYRVT